MSNGTDSPDYTDMSTWSDHQVATMAMAYDMLASYTGEYSSEQRDAFAELDRRYPGASDRMADHVTGTHMSSDDALRWVVLHWSTVVPYIMASPACEDCGYRGGHWHYCTNHPRHANRELWTDVP